LYLSRADLKQLDEQKVLSLSRQQKDVLLCRLLSDLQEAHDRLSANSHTSSRPPSSDAPWAVAGVGDASDEERAEASEAIADEDASGEPDTASTAEANSSAADEPAKRRPGRQPGAKGHSRTLSLPISATLVHRPESCVVCGQALEPEAFIASTGLYVLDIECETGAGLIGLRVRHDKHLYGTITCECGHLNHSAPGRCPQEGLWENVSLSEWHLVGPTLASLIVCLAHRLHLSRRRSQEFLRDWLGIELSTATLTHCLMEAGRAVEPVEEQLVEELRQASLVYVDETGWKEWGQKLWLWVISTSTLCVYFIGYRSSEILDNVFEQGFSGWLMSDGYKVYRQFEKRLRCWAHLLRKAHGLRESVNPRARHFGQTSHTLLKDLMKAIYRAREGPQPASDLSLQYAAKLDAFRLLCEQHYDCAHEKTRALAREFLNDWEAIWIVLSHPHLPLTNNEAERALRHWVIARRISHGTRTPEGSRALGLLASVIETCRKRAILPWPYLAQVIAERRKGNPAPPLPASAV